MGYSQNRFSGDCMNSLENYSYFSNVRDSNQECFFSKLKGDFKWLSLSSGVRDFQTIQ